MEEVVLDIREDAILSGLAAFLLGSFLVISAIFHGVGQGRNLKIYVIENNRNDCFSGFDEYVVIRLSAD